MKPLYFCYYTPRYAEHADELAESLRHFDLEYHMVQAPDMGSWIGNVCMKPAQIFLQMYLYGGDRPIVYLDADARIRKYPALFDDLDCDIGFHRKDGHELLSGTLYFGPTDAARNLVDDWTLECAKNPTQWDQKSLETCIGRNPSLRIKDIGASYVQIFDSMSWAGEPVIEHLQASRQLKV